MTKSLFNLEAFKKPSPEELIEKLIAAADKGDLETAKKLLGWDIYGWKVGGVDLNGTNKDKETALMHAAGKGHEKFVDWLIKELADTTAKDKNGKTAKDWAEEAGHQEIAKKLETADKYQSDVVKFKFASLCPH